VTETSLVNRVISRHGLPVELHTLGKQISNQAYFEIWLKSLELEKQEQLHSILNQMIKSNISI